MNIDRPFQRWNGSISTGYDVTLPYLLLDVREEKEWRKYHLIAALPYPSAYLKRDQFNREIMMYKNKKEKSIILYDQNESIAPLTAQLLVEKGFENIFVLSGGLNVLLPKFQGIATGLLLSPSFSSSSMFPKLSPLLHSCCSTPTPTSSTLDDSVDGYDMEALERCILNAATASVSSRSSSRLSQRTSFSSSSSSSSSTSLSTRGRRR
ncbi:Centrosomal protein of 41 kDa [Coelomomyces lativittatus]|nr:Centrosomal protein of 41 kDa [Coelomomyces lativittatus]